MKKSKFDSTEHGKEAFSVSDCFLHIIFFKNTTISAQVKGDFDDSLS